ncbi:UvrABC system protein C [Azospirillaceae bacterium]
MSTETRGKSLERGVAVIRDHLKTLPASPGVYRMINATGDALYVGKAKDLRKRVVNYTQPARLPVRLQRMIAETSSMEFITTHTEAEALLLEANLIKKLLPRYNVLLRDDKSFPYIIITSDHDFPLVTKHRGSRSRPGDYFGPFASSTAVNETTMVLQRVFMLRTCADTVFALRSRPCLQYQIKRCSAPCVLRVSREEYAEQVQQARDFLSGKSRAIQESFVQNMLAASDALDFETAAVYRDRIRVLTAIQARQNINLQGLEDADIVAAWQENGQTCVQVFFFRGGRHYGNRAYYPSHDQQMESPDVLAAFLVQFYENKPPPSLILISHDLPEQNLISEALTSRAGHKVEVHAPKRGDKRRPVEHALDNAREALARRQAENATQKKLLAGLAEAFGLDAPPQRIEVYDNSHIQGRHAVGAMIAAGSEGWIKSGYRKFNIRRSEAAGDDYAMMREVLLRRFGREQREDPDRERGGWPDLILIDGGQGQLNVALEAMRECGVSDIPVVGVAKGPDRDAGRERFFFPNRDQPLSFEMRDPVLFFLQRLRDEAHRFAIGAHRARRARAITVSSLDEIEGIGPVRKRALLHHFGSAAAVGRAGLTDLESVEGVSRAVARKIYDHFHPAEGIC